MTPAINPVTLYGFWRSNATYRVRVALNLKGVPYREIPVDLDAGEQHSADFLARNPFAAVPALVDGTRRRSPSRSPCSNISRSAIPSRPCCHPMRGAGRACGRSPAMSPATPIR